MPSGPSKSGSRSSSKSGTRYTSKSRSQSSSKSRRSSSSKSRNNIPVSSQEASPAAIGQAVRKKPFKFNKSAGLIQEATRYLKEVEGFTPFDVKNELCWEGNEPARKSKSYGPFFFTCERSKILEAEERGKFVYGTTLYVCHGSRHDCVAKSAEAKREERRAFFI